MTSRNLLSLTCVCHSQIQNTAGCGMCPSFWAKELLLPLAYACYSGLKNFCHWHGPKIQGSRIYYYWPVPVVLDSRIRRLTLACARLSGVKNLLSPACASHSWLKISAITGIYRYTSLSTEESAATCIMCQVLLSLAYVYHPGLRSQFSL